MPKKIVAALFEKQNRLKNGSFYKTKARSQVRENALAISLTVFVVSSYNLGVPRLQFE